MSVYPQAAAVVQNGSSGETSLSFNQSEIINNFSVVHYNVQSILNKIDILESELHSFNIFCFTETLLDGRTSDQKIEINGFNLLRRYRLGDNHGGVCVYADKNSYVKRRNDLEIQNVESIWLEVTVQHRKILIGTFYRQLNSHSDILLEIENSIGLAYDTNIKEILITGDFKFDLLKQKSFKKLNDVSQYFGLESLISILCNHREFYNRGCSRMVSDFVQAY